MSEETKIIEKQAYEFLSESKFDEAYKLFRLAGRNYKIQKLHRQATLCFASAASCWSRKHGEQAFYNAAASYEDAAKVSIREGDFEYAALLYRFAAINYERDREFIHFSDCFYRSKECARKFLTYRLFCPGKIHPIRGSDEQKGVRAVLRRFFQWLILSGSFLIWGHGERPSRTFWAGLLVIGISAFGYSYGNVMQSGLSGQPSFLESLYLSVVTFTTLGYGDIVPLGLTRTIAMAESFSGIFIMPLFLIGLSRKYMRI